MKTIEEIKWSEQFKGKEKLEYASWEKGKAIALSNGDPVNSEIIELMNDFQIAVWEGKITEEEREKLILSIFKKN
ncbi:hypothetical protein [Fusobacterium necrophorum]|uniref:Antitoxin VbhA domain-containing protein n=1 Tax=Fusobacterium necrophorum DJ-2 TaxID=1441737 RepID=A0AB73C3H3_9FUSO|nr:hypothetical protein [Fusobacterium necrophorum]KDE64337.1 hypothetical protein FUSO5_06570 [Fusobacterium necrophorum BFTR-1]KDE68673.1 hypothetical protein FUSO6_08160 [Fusobacterium necrophorum DAB]KDE68999.1 hypothetical protein FUSO7_12290 [Fusobacterium necrophorum BFTR-2]KDE72259.1 hypothetical protein FUSO8_05910 [Fusobacterium necrophorum DJ-2]MBR8734750.1 hypothetical protein [Fusobacterium necrophorum]